PPARVLLRCPPPACHRSVHEPGRGDERSPQGHVKRRPSAFQPASVDGVAAPPSADQLRYKPNRSSRGGRGANSRRVPASLTVRSRPVFAKRPRNWGRLIRKVLTWAILVGGLVVWVLTAGLWLDHPVSPKHPDA